MTENVYDMLNKRSNEMLGQNRSRAVKRTLSIRDRQLLFDRAHHKCEACGKRLGFSDMQVGHKTAWSRGGSTTWRNSVCLCYKHNRLQGTDSFATLMKKLGKKKTRTVTSPKRRKRTITRKVRRRSRRPYSPSIADMLNV